MKEINSNYQMAEGGARRREKLGRLFRRRNAFVLRAQNRDLRSKENLI